MQVGILYLIDRMALGGTEGQLRILMHGLDEQRFQPHLCTINTNNNINIPWLHLPFKSFYHPSLLSCLGKLADYIKKNNIHIVQTFFQDPTALAALSRPMHRAKLIGSFRDLGFWRNFQESLKMRMAYPFFDGFIANSNAVKDNFIAIDHIPSSKIKVIHNGISNDFLDSNCCFGDNLESAPLVGIVANFNREVKRIDDFIMAASLVKQQHSLARFIIVGEGRLRGQLEGLRHSLGLDNALTFTGRLNNPLGVIKQMTVGVNTSETEGFSNAILEYMACGVPVVATNNRGNAELVRNGENGFLVPVGDVSAIAERISILLDDKKIRQSIRANNIQRIRSEFSWEKMVQAHEAFYEQILHY